MITGFPPFPRREKREESLANASRRSASTLADREPLTHGSVSRSKSLAGVRILETFYAAGTDLRSHEHEEASLNLVLEGGMSELADGRTTEATPLALMFRPEGVRHSNRYPTDCRCLLVAWTSEASRFAALFKQRARHPYLSHGADAARALAVHRALCDGDASLPLRVEELILAVASDERARGEPGGRRPRWLIRAREALHEADTDDLPRLSSLATEAGVHPVYLARQFRFHFGCSIGGYLRRLRVERALTRLRRGELSLARIAVETGFYDQSHMNRCFKRETGLTPSAYLRSLLARS